MVLPIVFLGSWETCLLRRNSPQQSTYCEGGTITEGCIWSQGWSLLSYLERWCGGVGKLLEEKPRDLDSSTNCCPAVWS